MKVDLDLFEMGWLLDSCIRGSHLRSSTIERFVDGWYDMFTEKQRLILFEWTIRLSYAWSGENCFKVSDSCCGKDIDFALRYHPDNQYNVHTLFDGKKKVIRAYKKDGMYFVGSSKRIADEYITKVEKVDLSELWNKMKHPNIDYDKNILEHC